MSQCQGKTKSGDQCKLDAIEGRTVCATHEDQEEVLDFTREDVEFIHALREGQHLLGGRRVIQLGRIGSVPAVLCSDGTMWERGGARDTWTEVRGPDHVPAMANRHDLLAALGAAFVKHMADPDEDEHAEWLNGVLDRAADDVIVALREAGVSV